MSIKKQEAFREIALKEVCTTCIVVCNLYSLCKKIQKITHKILVILEFLFYFFEVLFTFMCAFITIKMITNKQTKKV
jgi:hypothetical protein